MSTPRVGEVSDDLSLIGRRDAFHVPGVLVKSRYNIPAGTKVRFTDSTCTEVVPMYKEDFYTEDAEGHDVEITLAAQAVVDPFKPYCKVGQLFWVFPVPESVSNLTHHFSLDTDIKTLTEQELNLIQMASDEEESFNQCKGCYS